MFSVQSIQDNKIILLQISVETYILNFDYLNKQMLNVFLSQKKIVSYGIDVWIMQIWNY